MIALWTRLPVVVRAVLTGAVVALVGTTPWALMVSANFKYGSAVPWSVPPTVLYLWFFWRYLRGVGPPRSTAELRHANLRAHSISAEVWGAALFAGILGLGAVLLLQVVTNRLVTLPPQQLSDTSHVPGVTLLCFLLTGSAVAGIVEEAAFRGYMQRPIERRHGLVVAILVTGTLFGFAHFAHPEVTLILMPYFIAVAAVYGALASLTNSIFPSTALHTGGNVLGGLGLLMGGRSEWQASPSPEPLIWETGADATFWIACVLLFVVGGAAVGAYVALARVVRIEGARKTV
jgi:membrane protease YdiL (CAAX protease family)